MRIRFIAIVILVIIGGISCEFSDKNLSTDGSNSLTDTEDIGYQEQSEVVEVTEPESWITDPKKNIKFMHITWQKDPSSTITFQWQSDYTNTSKYIPKVWIAKATDVKKEGDKIKMPFAKQYTFSGNGFLYVTQDINGNNEKRAQYTVEATGLEEDTEYYYRVGTFDDFNFGTKTFVNPDLSDVYIIKTGLKAGNKKPFTILSGGDSQSGTNNISENINLIKDLKGDFWIFYGDLNEVGTQPEWDAYFNALQPVLSKKVFMPIQGNHETIAELFYYQFALPHMEDIADEYIEQHYSFDYGVVHIVGLNSNTDMSVKSANKFLENDLKKARENSAIKWIIVMLHHPVYSACSTHGSTQRVIDNWVPIFEKYSVDLVLSGHDHNYERTYPIKENKIVSLGEGVQYVVCSPFMSPKYYSAGKDWWTYTSRDGSDGCLGVIDINDTELKYTAFTDDGISIIDQFTLKK